MTCLELVEYGKSDPIVLSADQVQVLRSLKCGDVESVKGSTGSYRIKAKRKVGSIMLGPVQINIRPKVA
ncbi:hypothetical protein, partial [Streptomyces sp. NPDC101166]|uniref:hypothetical protein n=1 Tax=Streptomyces sp. NPDC101166 TaxID=3366120 RepID=UPI00381A065F